MCLINFAFQHHPDYPLIVVGNRDEFYARPTLQANWWQDDFPEILAGRDLQEGGTWLGLNKQGKFAALTNYRDLKNISDTAPSRGHIVKRYLSNELPDEEMIRFLKTQGKLYNGFNIVFGNSEALFYYSNVNDTLRQLYPGIYGLSNAFLDTPWPKVQRSKAAFTQLIQDKPDAAAMMEIMRNSDTADDADLPETGVPFEWEKKLSAMFITSENYGTRLTTFVSIDKQRNVTFREKGYVPENDTIIQFKY
jgi:uncharacterized protein with NRDE domain